MDKERKYDNIINLPHHVSRRHPPLDRDSYAAQFSPFAALTGYDQVVSEAVRLSDEDDSYESEVFDEPGDDVWDGEWSPVKDEWSGC